MNGRGGGGVVLWWSFMSRKTVRVGAHCSVVLPHGDQVPVHQPVGCGFVGYPERELLRAGCLAVEGLHVQLGGRRDGGHGHDLPMEPTSLHARRCQHPTWAAEEQRLELGMQGRRPPYHAG